MCVGYISNTSRQCARASAVGRTISAVHSAALLPGLCALFARRADGIVMIGILIASAECGAMLRTLRRLPSIYRGSELKLVMMDSPS